MGKTEKKIENRNKWILNNIIKNFICLIKFLNIYYKLHKNKKNWKKEIKKSQKKLIKKELLRNITELMIKILWDL